MALLGELPQNNDNHVTWSREELIELLGNDRRRAVLDLLRRNGDRASVRDLAAEIAAAENDKHPERVTYRERKRVQTALSQFHLPKMDDHGLVKFDPREQTVSLCDELSGLDPCIEVRTRSTFAWPHVYLIMFVLNGGALLAYAAGTFALTVDLAVSWLSLLTGVLGAKAALHWYDDQVRTRTRLRD
jgi:hypothetical protein